MLQEARLPTADLAGTSGLSFWVSEDDSGVIGAVALENFGTTALVRSLVVSPAYRGRGVASALVSRAELEAQRQGTARLVLLTETAQALFTRLGYRVIERNAVPDAVRQSAEFRSLCPASAVCMSKPI